MTITVTNDFHDRSCNLRVPQIPCDLTESQMRKIVALCGHRDCTCYRHTIMADNGVRLQAEPGAGATGNLWHIVER